MPARGSQQIAAGCATPKPLGRCERALGSGLAATAVSRNAWRRCRRLARLPAPVIPLRNRLIRRAWLGFSERGLCR
jgi:hypothetical protein